MRTCTTPAAKECTCCHERLPTSQFRVTDKAKGRLRAWCRQCEAAEKAERRKNAHQPAMRKLLSESNRYFTAGAKWQFERAVIESVRACGGPTRFGQKFKQLHDNAVASRDYRLALRLFRLLFQMIAHNDDLRREEELSHDGVVEEHDVTIVTDYLLERFREDLAAQARG